MLARSEIYTGYSASLTPLETGVALSSLGTIIAIGGRADSSTLSFVADSVGEGGRLPVITLASDEPEDSFADCWEEFGALGLAEAVHIGTQQDLIRAIDRLAPNSPVYLSGGDQEALMIRLGGYMQDRLRQFHRNGGIVAGTSAGATAMGQVMIVGDAETSGLTWHIKDGLNLIPAVIDTHFTQRNRRKRLEDTVRKRGLLGIGIDEKTGFVVIGDSLGVIGVGSVYIFDRESQIRLVAGDRFDLRTRLASQGRRRFA